MATQPTNGPTSGNGHGGGGRVERSQPQAVEVEKAVLGAMLLDNSAISRVVEVLGDETVFYLSAHRKIYASVLALYDRGEPVDQIKVTEELVSRGQLEEVGGAAAVAALAGEVATSANAVHYSDIVLDRAMRRKLIDGSTQTVTESYEETEDVEAIIDRAQQRIFAIAERQMTGQVVSLKSALTDTFSAIEKAAERAGSLSGVDTGFGDLNYYTGGFQNSDMIILAARPSVGKTAMALNLSRNAAVKTKTPVLVFSLEMSVQQLSQRLLCAEARINSHSLRNGNLTGEDWERLVNWTEKLADAPIFIDDTPGISVMEMRAKARRAKMEHDIGLIVVDYLQLMTTTSRTDNREQEIASVSRSLKGLAKELDVPILALAQLSRAVELRTDKKPQLSDLRESGSIEQDADVVMFLHRPGRYEEVDEEGNSLENVAEVIIGKQRNGPTGTVELVWLPEYGRFEDREYMHLDESLYGGMGPGPGPGPGAPGPGPAGPEGEPVGPF